MKPSVIEFNGIGQPTTLPVSTGHIGILIQGDKKEVVRIELLTPDEYGPRLHHATNQASLDAAVERFWSSLDTSVLSGERDWIIDCPKYISQKATF